MKSSVFIYHMQSVRRCLFVSIREIWKKFCVRTHLVQLSCCSPSRLTIFRRFAPHTSQSPKVVVEWWAKVLSESSLPLSLACQFSYCNPNSGHCLGQVQSPSGHRLCMPIRHVVLNSLGQVAAVGQILPWIVGSRRRYKSSATLS